MNLSGYGPGLSSRPSARSDNCVLRVRQHPESAKVVPRGKDRDRKSIDPPPIVQLVVHDEYNNVCSFLHNPYFFCIVQLLEVDNDVPRTSEDPDCMPALTGTTVSSMYRLKDIDNTEGGFFIFGDLSARIPGVSRLKFTLYELKDPGNEAALLTTVTSQPFEVANAKDWDGVRESTPTSRNFADQGVRLRLRKESRNSASRRSYAPPSGPSSIPPTPIRPSASHSGSFESSASHDEAIRRQRALVPSSAAPTYPMGGAAIGSYMQPMYGASSGQSAAYQGYQSYTSGYGYGPGQNQGYSYPPQRGGPSDASGFAPQYASQSSQSGSGQYSQQYQPGYSGYPNYSQGSSYGQQAPSYPPQSSQYSQYRQPPYASNSSIPNVGTPGRSMANPSATPRLPPINQGSSGAVMPSIEDPSQAQTGTQGQMQDQRGMPGHPPGGGPTY
ncbi:MAG: hypothetical protein M1828_001298 [Chrysothrix sp. TS-e1954]|nr:MAG: hypothetical protein M1828_001298 [Chrysothrix sp. TS-e1954]